MTARRQPPTADSSLMSTPAPSSTPSILSPFVDNLLKILIAVLVSILVWLGTELRDAVEVLAIKIVSMEVAIAEMKVEIRHLSNGSNSQTSIR